MNDNRPTTARRLQQQPQRPDTRQQQQSSGSGEFQPSRGTHGEAAVQMGARAETGWRRSQAGH